MEGRGQAPPSSAVSLVASARRVARTKAEPDPSAADRYYGRTPASVVDALQRGLAPRRIAPGQRAKAPGRPRSGEVPYPGSVEGRVQAPPSSATSRRSSVGRLSRRKAE